MDRRSVLAGTGIIFSTTLAGCSEAEDESEEEASGDIEDQDRDENDGLNGNNSTNDTDQEEYEIQGEEEQDQDQGDAEDDEDAEPEEQPDVILPDKAEEHLDVLNHALDSDGAGCEFAAELERISSDDEYHVSFETKVTLYSDDGETIAEKAGPSVERGELGEDENRFYTVSFNDCEGTDQYTFEVVNFSAIISADAIEADVDIHPELEDKIEVDHGFNWVDEPGSGQCRVTIGVTNVTHDYVVSATVNSDDLDRGFTNLEPGESDEKEIEGSCTEDVESYLVQIGTSDYEIEEAELVNDHNEEIDAEGEVILSERAAEHLEVQDHALIRNGSDECEARIEVEKTTPETYLLSFGAEVSVYSDDGEEITRIGTPGGPGTGRERIEKGERRIYSSMSLENCEGAAEYEIDVRRVSVSVPIDELEPDFDLDPELEGKLEVIDSSISFEIGGTEYAPVYDAEYSSRSATVKNVTADYRLTVRGPDGEHRMKTVDLEPGDTADFALTGWKRSVSVGDLTYGFEIQAEDVEEIGGS
ncbi:hypothetical protein [Natrinema sp. SYSU A 869]|uniref:hypothetical protein n=1 Tax=Natrinema sp. SYSU A 869 TaxID=2871694 RepID=UPI001CA439E3|nr:hypothetical protein [Natrinema sp. SYSU A 869]